ncbi:MAG: hypothetical protein ACLS66_04900 [Weissella confusa]
MKSTDTSVKEREINLEDAGGGNKKNKQWLRFWCDVIVDCHWYGG